MSYSYPDKFVRDDVIAPFLLLFVVIVTLSILYAFYESKGGNLTFFSWFRS